MRKILSLPTDFLQHQELSQGSQVGFCAFVKMCFGCCVHFHARLQVLVQMQFRVHMCKVGASQSINSIVVF